MLWWKLQRLKSKDPKTRLAAVEEMIAQGGPTVLSPIAEALKDEDPNVRAAAAIGLGKLQDERALAPLLSALNDRKAEVRLSATLALRQLGDTRAIESLVQVLRDEDHMVRWHAAGALNALGWRPNRHRIYPALRRHRPARSRRRPWRQLRRSSHQRSAGPDCPRRNEIALALGKTGDSRAVKPLEAALKDTDNTVRVAAVEGLSQIGASPIHQGAAALSFRP